MPDPASKRLPWLDIARGTGILLVVAGHVGEGVIQAGLPHGSWMDQVVKVIYSFHMPLFFIISGFLFLPSFQKIPDHFLRIKAGTILYPYLLWTIVQTGIEIVLSRYTNKGIGIEELYPILWQPRAHFWYLHSLFLIAAFTYALFRITPRYAPWLGMILSFTRLLFPGETGYWLIPVNNLLYFNLGILFWQHRDIILERLQQTGVMLGLTTLFFLAQGAYAFLFAGNPILIILLAITGSAWILSLSSQPIPDALSKTLSYLGENSLYVYLLHILAGSGARIILEKFLHIQNGEIHFVTGCIAGVILPLLVTRLFQRFRMGWLFSIKF